jgi:hypothetical protein
VIKIPLRVSITADKGRDTRGMTKNYTVQNVSASEVKTMLGNTPIPPRWDNDIDPSEVQELITWINEQDLKHIWQSCTTSDQLILIVLADGKWGLPTISEYKQAKQDIQDHIDTIYAGMDQRARDNVKHLSGLEYKDKIAEKHEHEQELRQAYDELYTDMLDNILVFVDILTAKEQYKLACRYERIWINSAHTVDQLTAYYEAIKSIPNTIYKSAKETMRNKNLLDRFDPAICLEQKYAEPTIPESTYLWFKNH